MVIRVVVTDTLTHTGVPVPHDIFQHVNSFLQPGAAVLQAGHFLLQILVFLLEILQSDGQLFVLQLLHHLQVVLLTEVELGQRQRGGGDCGPLGLTVRAPDQAVGDKDTVGGVLLSLPQLGVVFLQEDVSAGVDDGPGECRVWRLHEVDSEGVLQDQRQVLVVDLARAVPGRSLLGETGQHHQAVVVPSHRTVLTVAVQPGAATAEFLLTANLAAGLPETPSPGPHTRHSLLLPGQRIHPLQAAVVWVELEVGGPETELVHRPARPERGREVRGNYLAIVAL